MNNKRIWQILLLCLFICSVLPAAEKIKISKDLDLEKISENSYIHITRYDLKTYKQYPANGLVYINNGQAIIIDTGWTDMQTRGIVNWLRQKKKVMIVGIVPTHWHIDCMGGLAEAHKEGINSYSHESTALIAKEKGLPVPKITFKDSLEIDVGGDRVTCFYPGPGHTSDNIVVWIKKEKLLFGGCLVKGLSWSTLGNTKDADVKTWPETLKKVIKTFKGVKIVIPGHGKHGNVSLLYHTTDIALIMNRKRR